MRVYITGEGAISSLGKSPKEMFGALIENQSAVQKIQAWKEIRGLASLIGAPAGPYNIAPLPRTARRTMSPMSEMASLAALDAMAQAGLTSKNLNLPRCLLAMGSTTGSPIGLEEYFKKLHQHQGIQGQSATTFFKVMNHSVASNVAVALEYNGPVIAPSCACASSAQAAVLGWELIQSGLYDVVICGGADELHYLSAGVFDGVFAASRGYNENPESSPRPFDARRDGLVVSEGASVVVMESERHLEKRGGKALAEFCGGAYLCESSHMSQNNQHQMLNVMNYAMERSGIKKDDVEYVSAHATGTLQGDAAEAKAIGAAFGEQVPVSSLKGHFGHSMAACGVMELIATRLMMEESVLIRTRNLEEIDPECSGVKHLQEHLKTGSRTALSNNFAFGGMNTSFIIRKV